MRKSDYRKSFRTETIKSQFDLNIECIEEKFNGNIPLENIKEWNVGIIFGASGTGKTTIAKEIFKDYYIRDYSYNDNSVIDNIPKEISVKDITKMFNAVGFATVWSWLKPYSVLSEGEKMRVNLARALLEGKDVIVFDEFTSVVNREVAQVSSFAISKTVKRLDKKFIAVSCHSDVIEWLEPDWVFDTNKMEYFETRGLVRRPSLRLCVKECQRNIWNIFKKYHYLNSELNKSAKNYVGLINDNPVIFCSVLHFPHPKIKNIKRVHRIVTLPDYQGIGLGINMLNFLGEYYKQLGMQLRIVFSTQALLYSFIKSDRWKLEAPTRKAPRSISCIPAFRFSSSMKKYTYSCKYI